jgi:hypothetical protein
MASKNDSATTTAAPPEAKAEWTVISVRATKEDKELFRDVQHVWPGTNSISDFLLMAGHFFVKKNRAKIAQLMEEKARAVAGSK